MTTRAPPRNGGRQLIGKPSRSTQAWLGDTLLGSLLPRRAERDKLKSRKKLKAFAAGD